MAKFALTTIERWEHRVSYHNVEAPSIEEAYKDVQSGNLSWDDQEICDDPGEVICLVAVEKRGKIVTVPPALAKWPQEPPTIDGSLLAAMKEAMSTYTPQELEAFTAEQAADFVRGVRENVPVA